MAGTVTIQDGTLTLTVKGAHAVVMQHILPEITERVNRFFGYPAVARIVIDAAYAFGEDDGWALASHIALSALLGPTTDESLFDHLKGRALGVRVSDAGLTPMGA